MNSDEARWLFGHRIIVWALCAAVALGFTAGVVGETSTSMLGNVIAVISAVTALGTFIGTAVVARRMLRARRGTDSRIR
jgi:cytochrome b561